PAARSDADADADAPPLLAPPPATLTAPLPEVAEVLKRVTPLLLQDVVVLPPTLLRPAPPLATPVVQRPAVAPDPVPAAGAQRSRRPLRPQVARTPQRAQLPSSLRPQRQVGRAVGEIHRTGSSLAANVR
ncbi:MAG: hypothetical protein CFE45_26490, partial [Burkholderiales bacterium PBB5]